MAQDIAASQAGIESQAGRDALAEAQLFGFEPGREGRSTLQQRGLAEDIAARQAQQDLQRSEIFGGAEGEAQTIRQQALAEDIAARTGQQDLARAEIYGGPEGKAQTLQQQLVENQLAGAPQDRAMMLTSQAIAAREAGRDTLADTIEKMITDQQTGGGGDNGGSETDVFADFAEALDNDNRLRSGTKFTVLNNAATNNPAIPPELAARLGDGVYGIDENKNIINMAGQVVITRAELRSGGK